MQAQKKPPEPSARVGGGGWQNVKEVFAKRYVPARVAPCRNLRYKIYFSFLGAFTIKDAFLSRKVTRFFKKNHNFVKINGIQTFQKLQIVQININ